MNFFSLFVANVKFSTAYLLLQNMRGGVFESIKRNQRIITFNVITIKRKIGTALVNVNVSDNNDDILYKMMYPRVCPFAKV